MMMNEQENLNYQRIAKAIEYINLNFRSQPGLEELAEQVNLSPFHFQRLFSEWAGTSPKKFLQYISMEYAKKLLKQDQSTLFTTALEVGFSGTSRLHDLFITIEGMTPAEYKNGGKDLNIGYSFQNSPFGNLIIASTDIGICHMSFYEEENLALTNLKHHFPNANFNIQFDLIQQNAILFFQKDWAKLKDIKLHLKGTDFQLKVWETLLKIPTGKLSTYGTMAISVDNPKASRAVGTAIGQNPVAYLIPCHRVIQASGNLGGYRWGKIRKTAILGWDQAMVLDG